MQSHGFLGAQVIASCTQTIARSQLFINHTAQAYSCVHIPFALNRLAKRTRWCDFWVTDYYTKLLIFCAAPGIWTDRLKSLILTTATYWQRSWVTLAV